MSRIEHVLAVEGFAPVTSDRGNTVPPALLEEVFELNEELDDIRSAREAGGDPARLRARLEAAREPIDRKRTAHEQDLADLSARWDAQADAPADERRRVLDQLRQRLLERNYLNNLIATIEREIAALGAARG